MQLYLVHCGFYNTDVCDGLFESHANFFVVAESFEAARLKAKALPEFQAKRMHVDGLLEIQAVDGYELRLELAEDTSRPATRIVNFKHRELATQMNAAPVK